MSYENRRHAKRYEVSGVAYVVIPYEDDFHFAHIIDISDGGLAFLSPESLGKDGKEFEFDLKLYDDPEFNVKVNAKLVHSMHTEDKDLQSFPIVRSSFQIELMDINERHKFDLLLSKYCIDEE